MGAERADGVKPHADREGKPMDVAPAPLPPPGTDWDHAPPGQLGEPRALPPRPGDGLLERSEPERSPVDRGARGAGPTPGGQ
jgi:hypothetical protein